MGADPKRITEQEIAAVAGESELYDRICPECQKKYRSAWPSRSEDDQPKEIICEDCQRLQEEAAKRRTRRDQQERLVGKLQIPPLYETACLASFEEHGPPDDAAKRTRVLGYAREYIEAWADVPSVILMVGQSGTGKGHVAYSILRVIRHRYDAVPWFVKLPDLIRDLREAWGRNEGPTEGERLRRYREADLLVIDEISRHAFYGEPTRHLYDLVDFRVEWLRPTILTTNEALGDFDEIVGPAVLSRIAGENGVWDFGETDYRPRRRRHAQAEDD